ncbi:MAG: cohesin domain-containing protein [Clostridia bacterium]
MKKILPLAIAFLLALSSISFSTATEEYPPIAVTLEYSTQLYYPGDTIDLEIYISENSNMLSGKISVYYDPEVIDQSTLAAEKGSAISRYAFATNFRNPGRATVGFASSSPSNVGGLLCTFHFTILETTKLDNAHLNVVINEFLAPDTSTLISSYFTNEGGGEIDLPIYQPEIYAPVSLSLSGETELRPGWDFSVIMNIGENSKLLSGDMSIAYDADNFDFISCDMGTALTENGTFNLEYFGDKPGIVAVSISGREKLMTGGSAVIFKFKVKETPVDGNYEFVLNVNRLIAGDGETELIYNLQNGGILSVNITTPPPEAEIYTVTFYAFDETTVLFQIEVLDGEFAVFNGDIPKVDGRIFSGWDEDITKTRIFNDTSFYAIYRILGDANGNETTNSGDVSYILRYATGDITLDRLDLAVADVNADGTINGGDAAMILMFLIRSIPDLPQH